MSRHSTENKTRGSVIDFWQGLSDSAAIAQLRKTRFSRRVSGNLGSVVAASDIFKRMTLTTNIDTGDCVADQLLALLLARANGAPSNVRADLCAGIMWPCFTRAWLMQFLDVDEKRLIAALTHLETAGYIEYELRGYENVGRVAVRMRARLVERVA